MGSRWWIACVLVCSLGGVAAARSPALTPAPPSSPTVDAANAPAEETTRWSRQHLFRASYVSSPQPVPLLTTHAWTVTIVDAAERPVADARVTVLGGMPAHGHGLPTTPQVKNLGDGRYLIEGLKFHMPGDWVVGLRIKAGPVVDSVQFDLHLG